MSTSFASAKGSLKLEAMKGPSRKRTTIRLRLLRWRQSVMTQSAPWSTATPFLRLKRESFIKDSRLGFGFSVMLQVASPNRNRSPQNLRLAPSTGAQERTRMNSAFVAIRASECAWISFVSSVPLSQIIAWNAARSATCAIPITLCTRRSSETEAHLFSWEKKIDRSMNPSVLPLVSTGCEGVTMTSRGQGSDIGYVVNNRVMVPCHSLSAPGSVSLHRSQS
jgi:hypothetical protein